MFKRTNKTIKTIFFISFYLLFFCPVILSANPVDEAGIAFSNGDYITAIKLTSIIIERTDDSEKVKALIRRGEAYRVLGHLREAQSDLNTAITLAQVQRKTRMEAIAGLSLGQLLLQQQHYVRASQLLETTQQLAIKIKQPAIAAAVSNALGSILFNQDRQAEASTHYRHALKLAKESNDIALVVATRRNLARVSVHTSKATEQLKIAYHEALLIPNLYERAELLLSIAEDSLQNDSGKIYQLMAPDAILDDVLKLSRQLNSLKLRSQAKGQSGAFYEKQQNFDKARSLTEQAIMDAQQINSDDLLLKWQWQSARILRAQGDRTAAISAYRRTVYYINAIRRDIPINYQDGRSSFRETLSPVYTGLADLLLQQAALVANTTTNTIAKNSQIVIDNNEQALLREARDTIEKIKLSELQDYFHDACITSRTEKLEMLASDTAVLYPIILPDRLELLLSIGKKLSRYSVNVNQLKLQKSVKRLVNSLRPATNGTLHPFKQNLAEQLYQWLINPILQQLRQHNIETLVFVPDGVLRSLPIAALSNGSHFLIEDFSLATVPGLTLFDAKSLPKKNMQTLLAGLSQPGPVVLELPELMWNSLAQNTGNNNRGLRGLPATIDQLKPDDLKIRGISYSAPARKIDITGKVQQALALPGVEQEIKALSELMQGQVLQNENFLLQRFTTEVTEKPYRIVHIASHGFFGGAPEQNFLMTYDHKLNMNQLSNLLQPKQLAEQPIELLTLSACQTAEGDDRSPLGLAGIALKSGARSILGTLWPIADEAAQQLLPSFYYNLSQAQMTKAKALQAAQIQLLKQEKYRHPFFWSAFLLIGNWL
ncbi:MAG: tetratricopeptide repeat protein [gamma proteobacterium symbiont of Taylorina sp.]|nr:tetratricopeptide repeat protein [gamma proteobacterium symbiont of Taylorina sp.]